MIVQPFPREAAQKSPWKLYAVLGLLAALPCVALWRPLAATVTLAWRNDEFTHILLIGPVSILLLAQQLATVRRLARASVVIGSVILLSSVAIAGVGLLWHEASADQRLAVWMLSLVTWWIGVFVTVMGTKASRVVMFPLLFLFGMVPVPQPTLDIVIGLLQQGSAWFASLLFSLCGIPFVRDGVMLTIPGLSLVVSQECSSIRSSTMLLVTTLVIAHLLLQSPWRKACLIAVALPLSLAKNGLRIFAIAMLTTKVDPGYMTGRFHRQGGLLFFVVALAGIYGLLLIFRRTETRVELKHRRASAPHVQSGDLASS